MTATVHQFHTVLPDLTFCGLATVHGRRDAAARLRRTTTRHTGEQVTHGRWEGVNCACCLDPNQHILVHYAVNLYAPDGEGLPAICGYRVQDDRRIALDTITTDDTRRGITCQRCLDQMRMQATPPPPVVVEERPPPAQVRFSLRNQLTGGTPITAALIRFAGGAGTARDVRAIFHHTRCAGVSTHDWFKACFPDEVALVRFIAEHECTEGNPVIDAGERLSCPGPGSWAWIMRRVQELLAGRPAGLDAEEWKANIYTALYPADTLDARQNAEAAHRELILDKATDLVRRWLESPEPLTYLSDKRRQKLEDELATNLELCPNECDRGQHPAIPDEAEPYRCRTCHGTGFVRTTE